MESLFDLGTVSLTIPAWQMALYIGLVGFYMICGKVKFCLLTTYVFGFYWGYYLFASDFMTAAHGDSASQSAYIVFGLLLTAFSLIAAFYEER